MEKLCTIYYGLSGTFKGTTIERNRRPEDLVLWSEIKTWKSLETGVFKKEVQPRNDINYAMLHLCGLEQLVRNEKNLIIERGITDMLFYHLKNTDRSWITEDTWITEAINKETEILREYKIKKILLIQKDEKFIEETVLSEPSRAFEFPGGVKDYMKKQLQYIDFTERYNMINTRVIISNAKDYIENNLKLKYKE